RARQLVQQTLLDFIGIWNQQRCVGRLVAVGDREHNAIIAPYRLNIVTDAIGDGRAQRESPRCMHARTERRQDADAPVAELIAESLDRNVAIGGQSARDVALLLEVVEQVPRGTLIETVLI